MLHLIYIETVVAERERDARETARRASLLRSSAAIDRAVASAAARIAAPEGRTRRPGADEAQVHPALRAEDGASALAPRRLSRPTSG